MHSVPWVAFYSSLETVYRSWDALVTYFANHKKDAKAVGFLKKLTQIENEGLPGVLGNKGTSPFTFREQGIFQNNF